MVSGGEPKVSRRVVVPRSSRAPRSKPKIAYFYLWWPSRDSRLCRHSGAPVSYLDATVPAAACETAILFRSAGCAFYLLCLFDHGLPFTTSSAPPPPWQERRSLDL
jgi:hypothetical protein